jgi:alkylation response protein AidB-like acyl-CoA dehydrogenase
MPVTRELPTAEAADLLDLAQRFADRELRPRADAAERAGEYPRDLVRMIGRSGLLGLPYPADQGGGGVGYETYLQVLEELARGWLTVALSVSVHTLSCFPLAHAGADEQQKKWLPDMLGGELLGAFSLSEPQAGSDAAALSTRAVRDGDFYVLNGTKAWITHAGVADFYTVFVRVGEHIGCLVVDAATPGLQVAPVEHKMGLTGSPTAQVHFSDARVPADRLIGTDGDGMQLALAALHGGRLGIAACAIGVAQAAFDYATDYARQRRQFDQPVIDFQGVSFLLADMATAIEAGRSLYLRAARLRDAGRPYEPIAAMAKLFCTDAAMRVTTDAVQLLGGAGYVEDHPVERWMREAKVMQIFEGTNQIQRVVISRSLTRD